MTLLTRIVVVEISKISQGLGVKLHVDRKLSVPMLSA